MQTQTDQTQPDMAPPDQAQQRPFGPDAEQQQAAQDNNRPLGEVLMDSGEQQASPQEQAQYNLVVSRAVKFIYGPGKDHVLKMLGSGNSPAESIGAAAASIGKSIQHSANAAGKPLDDGVLFHAGTEIVQELADFGEKAKVFHFNDEQEKDQQVEQGFLYALKDFGESGLQDGSIDNQEVDDSKRIMQQGIDSEAKYGNPAVRQAIQQAMRGQGGQAPPAQPLPPGGGIINGARA